MSSSKINNNSGSISAKNPPSSRVGRTPPVKRTIPFTPRVDILEPHAVNLRSLGAVLAGMRGAVPGLSVMTVAAPGFENVERLREFLSIHMPHVPHRVKELRQRADAFVPAASVLVAAEIYLGQSATEARERLSDALISRGAEEIAEAPYEGDQFLECAVRDRTSRRNVCEYLDDRLPKIAYFVHLLKK